MWVLFVGLFDRRRNSRAGAARPRARARGPHGARPAAGGGRGQGVAGPSGERPMARKGGRAPRASRARVPAGAGAQRERARERGARARAPPGAGRDGGGVWGPT